MFRVGIGYDVHRLVAGRRLILGGVEIPFERGLDGHSDADALLHAIIDALLGAACLGDIGTHFPDSNPRYKEIYSGQLLKIVMELLRRRKWRVGNIDSVIIAEQPRMADYIFSMRENIARICKIDIRDVSVKATTEEGLGLAGAGIGAKAVCTLIKET